MDPVVWLGVKSYVWCCSNESVQFCVVSNALRLNLCKIYDAHKDKKELEIHKSSPK